MENSPLPTLSGARQFWRGVQALLPILLGVIPFGVIYGVLARQAGMPVPAAPSSLPPDFALPLTFIALLVPALKDRAGVAAVLVAGCLALQQGHKRRLQTDPINESRLF